MKERASFIFPDVALRADIIKAVINAPAGYSLKIAPESRTDAMNRKFHAICGDLSRNLEFCGRVLSIQQWKNLLVSGHAIATNQHPDIVEGLEGELVNLRESTAQMSVKRMSSLIEYALYFCAENGVEVNL